MGHVFQERFAAVTHCNKLIQQFAVFAPHREVTLMIPHGGDDGRFRQGQVFFFKLSAQRSGIFHQIVHFFQQVRRDFHFAAFFPCQFGDLLPDHLPAFILIHNDKVLFQHLFIIVSRRDLHFAVAEEAVSHGETIRSYIGNGNRNDF